MRFFLSIVFTILLFPFPLFAADCTSLTNGLQGYWSLNESSGAASDSTANANTLTNNNTVTYSAAVLGNGANFVAASSQSLSRASASVVGLHFSGTYSLAGWVKFTSLPANNGTYTLASALQSGGYTWYFQTRSNVTQLNIYNDNGVASANVNVNWAPSIATWYYVAAINDSGANTVKFYVDGVQQGTTQTQLDFPTSASGANFLLGAVTNSPANFMNGSEDEWGAWSCTLTAAQITTLYNGGAGCAYSFASCGAKHFQLWPLSLF